MMAPLTSAKLPILLSLILCFWQHSNYVTALGTSKGSSTGTENEKKNNPLGSGVKTLFKQGDDSKQHKLNTPPGDKNNTNPSPPPPTKKNPLGSLFKKSPPKDELKQSPPKNESKISDPKPNTPPSSGGQNNNTNPNVPNIPPPKEVGPNTPPSVGGDKNNKHPNKAQNKAPKNVQSCAKKGNKKSWRDRLICRLFRGEVKTHEWFPLLLLALILFMWIPSPVGLIFEFLPGESGTLGVPAIISNIVYMIIGFLILFVLLKFWFSKEGKNLSNKIWGCKFLQGPNVQLTENKSEGTAKTE